MRLAQTPKKVPPLYSSSEVELQITSERISEMALTTLRSSTARRRSRRRTTRRHTTRTLTSKSADKLLSQLQASAAKCSQTKLPHQFIRKDPGSSLAVNSFRKSGVLSQTAQRRSSSNLDTLLSNCNELAKLTERTRQIVQRGLGPDLQSIHSKYDASPVRFERQYVKECVEEYKARPLHSNPSLRRKMMSSG